MKEEKKNKLKENISEILELPKDIMLDLPKITLLGNVQIFIENHKGIIEYTTEKVRINFKQGILKVFGKNLFIKIIVTEEIIITGEILSVEFDNRGV